jgi:hypothetical protein
MQSTTFDLEFEEHANFGFIVARSERGIEFLVKARIAAKGVGGDRSGMELVQALRSEPTALFDLKEPEQSAIYHSLRKQAREAGLAKADNASVRWLRRTGWIAVAILSYYIWRRYPVVLPVALVLLAVVGLLEPFYTGIRERWAERSSRATGGQSGTET